MDIQSSNNGEKHEHSSGMFSKSHLIASCVSQRDRSSGVEKITVMLEHSNVEQILRTAFSSNRKAASLPLAVLTVYEDSDTEHKPNIRELLVKWLIEYQEGTTPDLLGSFKLEEAMSGVVEPGSYLWPTPFIMKGNVLLWIIYMSGSSPAEIELFTILATSSVIQFNGDDLKGFSSQETWLSELHERLIKKMESRPMILAKLPYNDEPVTLKNFLDYLQWITDKVNKSTNPENTLYERVIQHSTPKEPTTALPKLIPTIQIDEYTAEEPNLYKTEVDIDLMSSSDPKQLCEKYQCPLKLSSANATLTAWIENSLTGETIQDMVRVLQTHLQFLDQHGILKEIQDLVQILYQFLSELHNMFDNFVCFSGDQDEKQMTRFFQVAQGHAEQALQQENHVHQQFIESLLKKSCIKLVSNFRADNINIINMEDILAKVVYKRILEAFPENAKTTVQNANPDVLEDIQERIITHSTGMMARSLDFSGKLNGVVGQQTWELKKTLNLFFQKIIENLPKPLLPKTGKVTVRNLVSMYVQEMAKIGTIFSSKSREQRKQCHNELVSKVLENTIDKRIIEEVTLRLNCYFLSANEFLEQALEKNDQTPPSPSTKVPVNPITLCIHLPPDGIRVGAKTGRGNMYLLFGPRPNPLSYCPPLLLLTNTNRFAYGCDALKVIKERPSTIFCKGTVTHYATNKEENVTISEGMLRDLFQNLKYLAEKALSPDNNYSRVLLVVPTWFNHDHRGRIRDGAQRAGFTQTFIMTEASLAAQMILSQPGNVDETFAVVVTLTDSQVEVRIYRKDKDQRIRLNAIAQVTAAAAEMEKRRESEENIEKLIHVTYETAIAQMGDEHKRKICIGISEKEEWRAPFKRFLEQRQDIERFEHGVRDDNHSLEAIMTLAQKPESIGYMLHDNGVDFDVDNEVDEEETENAVMAKKDEAVTRMRHELTEKCRKVRAEIENGKVRLGVLSKKLVMRALDGASTTAEDMSATVDDLEVQKKEVEELIDQYNFGCD